jgi:hypothetical protein
MDTTITVRWCCGAFAGCLPRKNRDYGGWTTGSEECPTRLLAIAAFVFCCAFQSLDASAQSLVRPQWNYAGSAVCPNNYDYYDGWCRARGYYGGPGYGRGYGGGGYGPDAVQPRWNRQGSAVCPNGYDYHAYSNLCRPQRY